MTQRICGARPSSYSPRLVGAGAGSVSVFAGATAPGDIDLRQWCTDTQDQIGSQCVGEAFANALWIATRNQGRRPSHRGIYVDARVRERMRRQDAIPDIGSDPADAADALVSVGVYPLDAKDNDPKAINAMADWAETSARKLVNIEHLVPIDKGDTASIDSVLAQGFPVVNWMPVDQTYMDLSSLTPWEGITRETLGSHCTVIVGRISGDFLVWNSWGLTWGQSGFAIIRRNVIAQNAGLCGILGGPVL